MTVRRTGARTVGLLLVLLLLLGGTGMGPAPRSAVLPEHPAPVPSGAPGVAAAPAPEAEGPTTSGRGGPTGPDVTYQVAGNVTTSTDPPMPVVGVGVEVSSRPCSGPVSAATCPYVASTRTDAAGAYALSVGPGDYFVHANNSSRWGGDWQAISVTSSDLTVNLVDYPWVPYGNATFVLPDWNNLSAYASNCNAVGPCGNGIYGTQTPVLSWTEDGAYYVNATGRLVFYSFATGAVRDIAYWRYLYDDLMDYQGIENTEWVTPDGAYVYEFGCTSDCSTATYPVLYAVNTTTGQTFNHTFSSVAVSSLQTNAQINLIGEAGNASIAVLFGDGSSVRAYNLWNGTEWTIGSVAYFEANNIYWISSLDSFVNIQAGGSSGDHIDQLRLEGPAPGTELVSVYSGTYATGFTSNGVNGMYVNVTSHRLVVSELAGGAPLRTEAFDLDATGTLTGTYLTYAATDFGSWPSDAAPPNAWSSEHRPMVVSDGPMLNGIWNGLFDNNSWLFEPSTGQFLETNLSFDHMRYGTSYRENSQSPAAVEGLFQNASYGLISESVNCRTNGTTCPLRGSANGAAVGTVWWTWRLGLPELPFSAATRGAETLPPGPVALNATATPTTIRLSWAPPATGAHPLLNYTLFWGPAAGGSLRTLDLWAQNTSAEFTNLTPTTPYWFRLEAWNLHWHNAGTLLNVSTPSPVPPLVVGAFTATPDQTDAGALVVLRVNASGGVAPLAFAYSGLPSGCATADRPGLNCTPGGAGLYQIRVNVTDGSGQSASATAGLVVGPALGVTVVAAPPAADAPGVTRVTAVVNPTGTAPYTFAWTLPSGPASGASVDVNLTTPGRFVVGVNVTDAFGGRASADTVVVANPPPTLQGTVTPGPDVDLGRPLWVNLSATGGTGSLTVSFPALPPGCQVSAPGAATCAPTALGSEAIDASAVDAVGTIAVWVGGITVHPDPTVRLATAPASGGAVEVVATVTGGVAPYTFTFLGLPTGCAPPPNASGTSPEFACRPPAGTRTAISVVVVDADGAQTRGTATLEGGPVGPPTGPDWRVPAALGGLAAGLAAVVVVGLRRRGSRGRTPPPSPSGTVGARAGPATDRNRPDPTHSRSK